MLLYQCRPVSIVLTRFLLHEHEQKTGSPAASQPTTEQNGRKNHAVHGTNNQSTLSANGVPQWSVANIHRTSGFEFNGGNAMSCIDLDGWMMNACPNIATNEHLECSKFLARIIPVVTHILRYFAVNFLCWTIGTRSFHAYHLHKSGPNAKNSLITKKNRRVDEWVMPQIHWANRKTLIYSEMFWMNEFI